MKELKALYIKLTKERDILDKKHAKAWAEYFKTTRPKISKQFLKHGMFKSIQCGSSAYEDIKGLDNVTVNSMLKKNQVVLLWSDFYEDLSYTGLTIPKSHIGGYLSGSMQTIHATDP